MKAMKLFLTLVRPNNGMAVHTSTHCGTPGRVLLSCGTPGRVLLCVYSTHAVLNSPLVQIQKDLPLFSQQSVSSCRIIYFYWTV